MTRSNQRFTIAIAVLTLDAALLASLIFMALQGKHISGENILFVVAGIAMGWGTMVLGFYFGTSESSVHKTEIMERADDRRNDVATGKLDDPVHVEQPQ